MLQITGHLAYKGILAGGATTSSPLFRLIEVYRGTLVVDALSNLSETTTSSRGLTVKQIAEEVNRVQVDIGEEMTPKRVGGFLGQ